MLLKLFSHWTIGVYLDNRVHYKDNFMLYRVPDLNHMKEYILKFLNNDFSSMNVWNIQIS